MTQGPERKVSDLELKETKKDAQGILLILKNPVKVDRDFRLDFLVQNGNNKQMKMYLWLNTAFIDPSGYVRKPCDLYNQSCCIFKVLFLMVLIIVKTLL